MTNIFIVASKISSSTEHLSAVRLNLITPSHREVSPKALIGNQKKRDLIGDCSGLHSNFWFLILCVSLSIPIQMLDILDVKQTTTY